MASIGSLYEKFKPFIWIPIAILAIWIMVSDLMDASGIDEYGRTVAELHDVILENSRLVGIVVSELSDIEAGLGGVQQTVDDWGHVQDELRITVGRLEEASLGSGDHGTELGILADRLYRVNRELESRLQEVETE